MSKIVYHPDYNISLWGLEKLHPFPSNKYKRIKKMLDLSGKFKDAFVTPRMNRELIWSYLDPEYREKLRNSHFVANALEVPILGYLPYSLLKRGVVDRMILASCGTILAANLALEEGVAVNLGGGFHHARWDHGHGFCIVPDISIAIRELLSQKKVSRVTIVDLDAHLGDGNARSLAREVISNEVQIIDFYDYRLFPNTNTAEIEAAKKSIEVDIGLGPLRDDDYLRDMDRFIFPQIDNFGPDLIVYNAGTDIYCLDPLSFLQISWKGIIERDRKMFDFGKIKQIPVLMVLSGGYHRDSARIVAESLIQNLV
ncbi:MAG: histone deacetylase 11-like [Parcubacteria group bacterium Gr01-1014_18]|nr:MAG: histone deacetylase 11-like [Parcubacteria group bacterium Greene0416_36]TSC80714.1 MAG: histone deacetylase 11-like [Parcubacteria group bacterium Gr01-1014_18]TSC98675.1 MAG: histone deacetylase 11-like [Parcubacteria group bacterium Greene1014_20]TSD07165.1 MAG: histone deacetylase 11-like [Parcubacteria group bacterium Greene0714_2]